MTKRHSRKSRFSFDNKQTENVRSKTFERKSNIETFDKIVRRNSSKDKERYNKMLIESIKGSPLKFNYKSKGSKSQKIVEYWKDVLTKILKGLFSNYKKIPISIRLICKLIYEELVSLSGLSEEQKKQRALGILSDIIYSNWLITPLFLQPTAYGLIKNNDMNLLFRVLLDLSKIVAHVIKGIHIYGPHMLTWMWMFSEYIEKNSVYGSKFLNSIINVNVPKWKTLDSENLIDIMITSCGLIYKMFRVWCLYSNKLQSNSLK